MNKSRKTGILKSNRRLLSDWRYMRNIKSWRKKVFRRIKRRPSREQSQVLPMLHMCLTRRQRTMMAASFMAPHRIIEEAQQEAKQWHLPTSNQKRSNGAHHQRMRRCFRRKESTSCLKNRKSPYKICLRKQSTTKIWNLKLVPSWRRKPKRNWKKWACWILARRAIHMPIIRRIIVLIIKHTRKNSNSFQKIQEYESTTSWTTMASSTNTESNIVNSRQRLTKSTQHLRRFTKKKSIFPFLRIMRIRHFRPGRRNRRWKVQNHLLRVRIMYGYQGGAQKKWSQAHAKR